jgi:hypothetical protein
LLNLPRLLLDKATDLHCHKRRKKMKKRLLSILAALLLVAVAVPAAWAALAAAPGGLGTPIDPHGFPSFYMDTANLQLEPCLPQPAGNSTRPELCIFDPVDTADPNSVALGVGGEIFWWGADAEAPPLVAGGKALLVLALEGAFMAETPADGQQMTFGRVRIRVDTPVAGTYTVVHPFGVETFEVTDVAAGINFTEDLGSINFTDPTLGFAGALAGDIGPFLTWPDFDQDPSLQVLDATGNVLEQYVGDPNVPHVVTGSPTGNNFFRIVGPAGSGINVQTNLFTVMGKVFDPAVVKTAHVFPPAPTANLFAVGPVNRATTVDAVPVPGVVTGPPENLNYPKGYPLWYQENAGTAEAPVGGLQLTICPASDPMCISAPIDPADPASVQLRTGEEGFWWSGEAFINTDTVPDAQGVDGLLVLAMEAAFGGTGVPAERQQIAFGRLRIRVDVPVEGHYTITHPYGVEEFDVVFDPTETDPDKLGRRAINMTRDVGAIDPANPDSAFRGALFSDIGPLFLRWTNFDTDPALKKPVNPTDPLSPVIQYLGNPLIPHAVTGSPFNTNFFRIVGPGINVQTDLFAVSGKIFDGNFAAVNPLAPLAVADAVETFRGVPVTINVLANDTINAAPLNPATVSVTLLPAGAASGTLVLNADKTVRYTPNAGFVGTDTFAYQFTQTATGLTSNNGLVTVTVAAPPDIITLKKARVDLAKLAIEVEGTDNVPGSILTIHAGATAGGPVLGTVLVPADGVWRFRGRITSNLSRISITSSNNGTLLNQPVQVQ